MEKCYNIVDMEGFEVLDSWYGGSGGDGNYFIGNSVFKKIVYILKWITLHPQSHTGHVVMPLGNRSITCTPLSYYVFLVMIRKGY